MLPVGLLMVEHRLIERMVSLLNVELSRLRNGEEPDLNFFDSAIDFIRIYADKCHHGKEENILFKSLAKKKISLEHEKMMEELISEHIYGRKTLDALSLSKDRYVKGDSPSLMDLIKFTDQLVIFYPEHINKEDKGFFIPSMEYFDKDEQSLMIDAFLKFDQTIVHEKYKMMVEGLELLKL